MPLTWPTRVSAAKVGLEQARAAEGMGEVLAKALQLKNDPLDPFPMDLPLTGHTRVLSEEVLLERAREVEGIGEVLAEAFKLKNNPLALFPTECCP